MLQYKVFKHPSGSTEAVKQGWSWPALFFGVTWAIVKNMWGLGMGFLSGSIVLGLIIAIIASAADDSSGHTIISVVNVAAPIANIIFGLKGNSWREKNLASRGFKQVDTITAANPEGATALYVKAQNADANPAVRTDAAR